MKTSKFLSAILLAIVCILGFTTCSNDDDGGKSGNFDGVIKVTLSTGNTAVDEVRPGDGILKDEMGVNGKYENGGFTLKLPNPVAAQYLALMQPAKTIFSNPELIADSGITISDTNTQDIAFDYIKAYKNGNENEVGVFYCENENGVALMWVYVDRDASIKGSHTKGGYTDKYNLSLKKGWNKTYQKGGETSWECTSIEPSGMKWHFEKF
ncbi:MAG: hypothetical protein LBN93_10810 [Candidatus Symbiothrix sp.]|jgi:fibronectin type 3 domain-containing protein|nr:hypothetical protein [Candidatus Symbiothrix sp.]